MALVPVLVAVVVVVVVVVVVSNFSQTIPSSSILRIPST